MPDGSHAHEIETTSSRIRNRRTNHLLGEEFGPCRFETRPVTATVTKRWQETADLGIP
jgi:hypothetical protein